MSGNSAGGAELERGEGGDLRETAALWYDRFNRERISEETRAEGTRWLEASARHRAAYEAVAQAWTLAQQAAHDPRIMALRHEAALRLTRRSSRWSFVSVGLAAAAALVAVGVALALALNLPGGSFPWGQRDRYSTVTGERLTVTLKDGSQVTLNTQTRIKTSFDSGERRVQLEEGQALFEVAKDPLRPFVVLAQGRRFVAVGTAFDVRIDGDRVRVTMVEGTVKVVPRGPARESPDKPGVLLSAGQQLIVDSTVADPEPELVSTIDAERVTSWRRGQVIFSDTSLAEAVAELNRYSEQKIVLATPALADLKLSGAFATGRAAVFVEALTTYFPVKVVRVDDRALVLDAR